MAETVQQIIDEKAQRCAQALGTIGPEEQDYIKTVLANTFYDACRHERRQASILATKKAVNAATARGEGQTGLAYHQGYRVACEELAAQLLSQERTKEVVVKEVF